MATGASRMMEPLPGSEFPMSWSQVKVSQEAVLAPLQDVQIHPLKLTSSNRACKRTLLFADGIGPMHSPLAEGYGYSHRTNAG